MYVWACMCVGEYMWSVCVCILSKEIMNKSTSKPRHVQIYVPAEHPAGAKLLCPFQEHWMSRTNSVLTSCMWELWRKSLDNHNTQRRVDILDITASGLQF